MIYLAIESISTNVFCSNNHKIYLSSHFEFFSYLGVLELSTLSLDLSFFCIAWFSS